MRKLTTEFREATRASHLSTILAVFLGVLMMALSPTLQHAGVGATGMLAALLLGAAVTLAGTAGIVKNVRFRRGDVEIDDAVIRLGGEAVPRSEIKSAYFAPGFGKLRSSVRLLGAKQNIRAEIAVDNEEQATQILDALKLGAAERAARFRAIVPKGNVSRWAAYAMMFGGFVMMTAAAPIHLPFLMIVGIVALIAGSAVFLPCNVDVGADGMLIKARIHPRFVSWSEVDSIEAYPQGLLIKCKNNETITLPTTAQWSPKDYDKVVQASLIGRAQAALAAYRRDDNPDVAARVARGGRKHADWMRALFDREGSFRTAPVLDDQLWDIVESPTAESSARAGAAAVLARAAGEADRSRLRIAAEACTAPRLRVVLDRAASGVPDQEVEEALVDLEEDEEPLKQGQAY